MSRLIARLYGRAIDDQLLAGAPVNGSPVARARLGRVLDRDYRRRVADALRSTLATATRRYPDRFGPQIPLQVHEVLETAPLILKLATELEREDKVNPRGVILADRLIRDGGSPIYWRCKMAIEANPPTETVETAVRHARAALLMS
jgi:hypothetical protein